METNPNDLETLKQVVAPDQAGARLDRFLAQTLGWSRARWQKLLKSGLVKVNGGAKTASYRVRAGEAVTVRVPPPAPSPLTPEPLALPPLGKSKYVRPPMNEQHFIPEVYR